ncbi:Metallo-dependent phosphatase-like protein [Spinellus fusiger]|nr:Metallo-dependent phosphatase-like protein [Spinellus fusiger]
MRVILASILALAVCAECAPVKSKPKSHFPVTSLKGKFLHITDIHLDAYYLANSDPSQFCHRMNKKNKKNTAGQFGAVGTKCDSPASLVQASFDFMKKTMTDIDFIIYTGDTARHDRDNAMPRTDDDVLSEHAAVTKYFQDTFNINNVPLIPTIGNNDMFGHNKMGEEDPILPQLKKMWAPFNLNLTASFDEGGYFVQDLVPGKIKAVSVNSMYFFSSNKLAPDCDTASSPGAVQLTWLSNVLNDARSQQESVYIVGHVPPNDDDGSKLYRDTCYDMYMEILGSFGDVISGHFTGHTNTDMLTAVVKSDSSYTALSATNDEEDLQSSAMDNPQVTTVLFNAPSIIPVHNPGIRVYNYAVSTNK